MRTQGRAAVMHHYAFHIGDYASHTRHLSLLEDLAYRRILDLYYLKEQPLPVNALEVCRLIGMPSNLTEVETVLREFFREDGAHWRNERCDEEIGAYKALVKRNQKNGSLGGRPRSRRKPTGLPVGCQSQPTGNPLETQPVPGTSTQEPEVQSTSSATRTEREPGLTKPELLAHFEDLWRVYGRRVEKKAAVTAWLDLRPDLDLCSVIMVRASQFVLAHPEERFRKHLHRWLKGRCWEDEDGGKPIENGYHANGRAS